MHRCTVSIDGGPSYPAADLLRDAAGSPILWNGWDCPLFDAPTVARIVADYGADPAEIAGPDDRGLFALDGWTWTVDRCPCGGPVDGSECRHPLNAED